MPITVSHQARQYAHRMLKCGGGHPARLGRSSPNIAFTSPTYLYLTSHPTVFGS
jgi:hypothetical protein